MCNRFRWSALTLFLILAAVSPTLASSEPTPLPTTVPISLGPTHTVLPDSLRPTVTTAEEPSLTHLQPVALARVPSYSVTTPTMLTAAAQPIGFQSAGGTSDRHIRWAIYGAVAGLAIGLIDGHDAITDGLIGAGIGLGLSFVIHP